MYIHVCLCVYTCTTVDIWRSEETLQELGSLLLLCGSQGSNSCHQAWRQALILWAMFLAPRMMYLTINVTRTATCELVVSVVVVRRWPETTWVCLVCKGRGWSGPRYMCPISVDRQPIFSQTHCLLDGGKLVLLTIKFEGGTLTNWRRESGEGEKYLPVHLDCGISVGNRSQLTRVIREKVMVKLRMIRKDSPMTKSGGFHGACPFLVVWKAADRSGVEEWGSL